MKIESLFVYPIKSSTGFKVGKTRVFKTGFEYDRFFAVVDTENKILTARENKKILHIDAEIKDKKLVVSTKESFSVEIECSSFGKEQLDVDLFGDTVKAKRTTTRVNTFISTVIGETVSLVCVDSENLRKVKPQYNGKEKDNVLFGDIAPIHLISEASLKELNSKLENPVTVERFRPNIVVSGFKAFDEDHWKSVFIGGVEFEVILKTPRCSFVTIDPKTTKVSPKHEPLRTLSKFRKEKNNVNFGIYLVPKNKGVVNLNDELKVVYH